jgi:hypothetical protein
MEIRRKQEMIGTIKEMPKFEHIDEILQVITPFYISNAELYIVLSI